MDPESLQALLKQLQGLDEPPLPSEQQGNQSGAVKQGDHQADTSARESDANNPIPEYPGNQGEAEKDALFDNAKDTGNTADVDVDQNDTPHRPSSLHEQSDLQKLLQTLQPVLNSESESLPRLSGKSDYALWYEDDSRYYLPETPTLPTLAFTSDEDVSKLAKATTAETNLRSMTYAQALPILSKLAGELAFVESFQQLRRDQEAVELQLLDERNKVRMDLEKQINQARTKRSQPNQLEIERLAKSMNTTLSEWDKMALKRWDSMARTQQGHLQALGVPCFYMLSKPDSVAQERQRRVMETLVSLVQDV